MAAEAKSKNLGGKLEILQKVPRDTATTVVMSSDLSSSLDETFNLVKVEILVDV